MANFETNETNEINLTETADMIRSFEYLDNIEDDAKSADKLMLFLVVAGRKKLAAITPKIDKTEDDWEKKKEETELLFDDLGLKYIWKFDGNKMDGIVSKNQMRIMEWEQSFEDDIRRGLLLGYPKTACKAFQANSDAPDGVFNTKKSPLLTHEEQNKILEEAGVDNNFYNFIQVRMSRAHYPEELKQMIDDYNFCKKYKMTSGGRE